ncbi:hypothetical protein N3K63_05285 [Microbacterium sp. W1N]|uniref:hypothetical protein n=1 Tax=Microbacterium festucae TaxID=2977531 RepID=UPI0021BEE7AA|nr:hypothetical protein [Microbacterium festucae]MCT9819698.1 hypothetical protein [Microbacterium festucae]
MGALRVGPLTAVDAVAGAARDAATPDAPGAARLPAAPVLPAVAIGDVAVRHVRLTTSGVELWQGAEPHEAVAWGEVADVELDLPTTRLPSPLLADSIGPVLLGVLGDAYTAEPNPVTARVVTRSAGAQEWELDGHHVTGYRRRDAELTERLVARLVAEPDARVLLAVPGELLARLGTVARPRR